MFFNWSKGLLNNFFDGDFFTFFDGFFNTFLFLFCFNANVLLLLIFLEIIKSFSAISCILKDLLSKILIKNENC